MEEKEYKYRLEKYSGPGSRHECPRCHDKKSFVYYIDEEGVLVDKTVGRCNHESSCGYHYKPSDYFHDNCIDTKDRPVRVVTPQNRKIFNNIAMQPSYIQASVLVKSLGDNSTFVDFLKKLIKNDETVKMLCKAYQLGCTYMREVIFWQIDYRMRVRSGKIMAYDIATGKRDKSGKGINWIHKRWEGRKGIPKPFNLKQCLFGEHLLALFPAKPVAVVESEKTAILGFAAYPEYVWVATGGKSQTSVNKMAILRGRNVILFPDVDGYEQWKVMAESLTFCNVVVSDVLEKMATDEDREAKIDIGDIIIRQFREGGFSQNSSMTTLLP